MSFEEFLALYALITGIFLLAMIYIYERMRIVYSRRKERENNHSYNFIKDKVEKFKF